MKVGLLLFCMALLIPTVQALGPVAPVAIVHGQGEAEYTNFSLEWLECKDFAFDIEMTIDGDTAYVTMQAVHPVAMCTQSAQFYSLNPVVLHGSWEEGWEGHAVGAEEPVQHWPVWDIRIEGNYHGEVWLWSWYVDENDREHLFEGTFRILTQI